MKTYKVIGNHAVRGVTPGGTFSADLTEFEESTLVEGGHIELVEARRMEPAKRQPVDAGEEE